VIQQLYLFNLILKFARSFDFLFNTHLEKSDYDFLLIREMKKMGLESLR
jgi:hypothetical protein